MGKKQNLNLQPPKEYWEDRKWAYEHSMDLSRDYPNQWVAIVGKKVLAVGETIAEVRKAAEKRTGRKEYPVIFAERAMHVYYEDVLTNIKLVSDYKK